MRGGNLCEREQQDLEGAGRGGAREQREAMPRERETTRGTTHAKNLRDDDNKHARRGASNGGGEYPHPSRTTLEVEIFYGDILSHSRSGAHGGAAGRRIWEVNTRIGARAGGVEGHSRLTCSQLSDVWATSTRWGYRWPHVVGAPRVKTILPQFPIWSACARSSDTFPYGIKPDGGKRSTAGQTPWGLNPQPIDATHITGHVHI